MKLFPGHILIANESQELYTVMGFKNNETVNIKNMKSGITERASVKDIPDNYTLLKPAGYVCFNIVDLKNNLQDVLVSLFRPEDIEATPSVPYAVCRQCIIDFVYQQFDANTDLVGISISQDTCPANVDFNIMLSCNGIHTGSMVAVYLDYNLDKILSFVKAKSFDNVLYADLMEYAKGQADKYGNYVYNNIISKDCYKGYCKDLRTLLESNNFMHDFYRAFNIYNFDFDLSGRNGKSLNTEEVEVLSTILCRNIVSTVIVKYWYDIDITNVSDNTVLIADKNGCLYVIGFAVDKTKPYEVPVASVESEDNIYKLEQVMTKAGKNDMNIRKAYDHVIFNSNKYK